MITKDPLLGSHPPMVNTLGLPEEEQWPAAEHMAYASEMWAATLDFNAALSLFKFCNDPSAAQFAKSAKIATKFNSWKLIAARDGVWSIYNLGVTMRHFRAECGKLPTFNRFIDHNMTRTAVKLFEASFPDYDVIRNALGHIPESTKNPSFREKNEYIGPFRSDGMIVDGEKTRIMIKNSLHEDTYQTTFDGRLLTCEISDQTLSQLVRVKDQFYAGLQPLATEMAKAPWSQPQA